MANSVSSVVVLLMFLVAMDSATKAFGSLRASVIIYNQITVGSPVKVRCNSRHNDIVIPWTTLQSSGSYVGWGFKASIWGGTRFSCRFVWEALTRYQDFDVWVDYPPLDILDTRPCTHCVWHVTLDGFKAYERGGVLGRVVEEYPWRSGWPPWT